LNEQIARDFLSVYLQSKEITAELKDKQRQLYSEFDSDIDCEQSKIVRLPRVSDSKQYVINHFPDWELVELRDRGDEGIFALLKANPSLQPFSCNVDGYIIRRNISRSETVHLPYIQEDDPDLYQRVTMWPEPLYSMLLEMYMDNKHFESERMVTHYVNTFLEVHGVERVLKEPKDIDAMDIAKLGMYTIVKTTPRFMVLLAKDEEHLE